MPRGSSTVGAIQGGRVAVAVTLDDSQFVLGTAKVRNSLKKLSSGLNAFSNSVIRTGMALGVPLAAALRQFTEFDHQMRVVRAVTQSNEAQFAALTARARELGKTTSWTAREVAEGMTSLGRMGWKPKEIDSAISAMMDLARATDSDVATVSTLASNTMRAFKASSDQATHYADILAVAANKSSQTVVDIGEAMTIVGPLAATAGESVEDLAAALMVMANNGVRGSIAGTALRNALTKLNDPLRQELLDKYNIKVKDVYGNMRRLVDILDDLNKNTQGLGSGELINLYAELFGLRGMLGGAVITNNIDAAASAKKAISESGGEADRVARGIEEGLWGAVKFAVSAFQDLGLEIGNAFSPAIQSKLGRVTTLVRAIGTWVKQNREQVKQAAKWLLQAIKYVLELKVALKLGAAIHGVTVFASAFSTLATNIKSAKTAMEGFTAAQGAMGAAGAGGALAGGAGGAGAVAEARGGAGAAGGGGALGTAANGAIVGSSIRGMGGGAGVRGAFRDWRASTKEVAALRKEAQAKSVARAAAEANAKAERTIARGRLADARMGVVMAEREASEKVAAQKAAQRAYRQTSASVRSRVGMARAEMRGVSEGLNAAQREAIYPKTPFGMGQALKEQTRLLGEQERLQGTITQELKRQQEALARSTQAGRAARAAKSGIATAGNRLSAAETAVTEASKLGRAERASSIAANTALMAGMANANNAAANLATAIATCVTKIGLLAAVAGTAYLAFKQWGKYLGLKAELVAQNAMNSMAEADAKQRGRENLEKITERANADAVRQQIDWLRAGLGEIVAYVYQQNEGKLTERGREMMMNRARGIGEAYGTDPNRVIAMAVESVHSGNYDQLNAWMKSMIDWEKGYAQHLFAQGFQQARNLDLQGTDEYKAFVKAAGRLDNLDTLVSAISAISELDKLNETGASRFDRNLELPKTEDLAAEETSLAESMMTPYQKSIDELAKRQERYAALIKDKTAELQRLIDTGAGTSAGRETLQAEIDRLATKQAEFNRTIEAQTIAAKRNESMGRIDRVYGAVAEAIKQQAAYGTAGERMAERLRDQWIVRFTNELKRVEAEMAKQRQAATDVFGDGGAEITENERARMQSLSEVFTGIAAKLNELKNLDIGEADKAVSASAIGSFKASEVFGQIMPDDEYAKETAKNTQKTYEMNRDQLKVMRAIERNVENVASNSTLLYG